MGRTGVQVPIVPGAQWKVLCLVAGCGYKSDVRGANYVAARSSVTHDTRHAVELVPVDYALHPLYDAALEVNDDAVEIARMQAAKTKLNLAKATPEEVLDAFVKETLQA